jgi:hypothetical protein
MTAPDLNALNDRINAATAARARAQVEYDGAVRQRDEALAALKAYGVSSVEEARALLESLEADLARELAAVEEALKEAGA